MHLSAIKLLVAFSFNVYAAGSSTYSSSSSSSGGTTVKAPPTPCDDLTIRKDRIRCRLARGEEGPATPEACQRLEAISLLKCRNLYSKLSPCYNEDEKAKDACFRRIVGLGTGALSGEADKEALRDYIVALLYEMQERIESMQEEGDITLDEAAEVIDMIVEIKENIMSRESKDIVRPKLVELKADYLELRQ